MANEAEAIDPDKSVHFSSTRKAMPPIIVDEDNVSDLQDAAGEKVVVDLKGLPPEVKPGQAAAKPRAGGATVINENDDDDDDDDGVVPPAAAKPPTHTSADVAFALELGIPLSEIGESTPGELKAAIRAAARNQRRETKAPVVPAPEPEIDLGLTREEEDLLDPEVLKVQKKIAKNIAARAKAVEDKLEADRAERQHAAQSDLNRKVHAAFTSLGNPELFGSEPSALTPEQISRRRAVIAIAQSDQSGGSVKSIIRKAVQTLYPDTTPASVIETGGKKLSAAEARWIGGTTPAAVPKKEKKDNTPEGREKAAVKKIQAKYFAEGTNGATPIHADDGAPV